MNNPHHAARLAVHCREQIVARVFPGQSAAEVAAAFAVSVRTVRKWLARFHAGGGAAHSNRASAPVRVSGRMAEATVILILHPRLSLRLTRAAIAAKLGLARSTVSHWLRREGLGRLARIDPPEPVRRDQRERPGELIHLDIKKSGRFDQPGHRVTGTRVGCRNRGAGRNTQLHRRSGPVSERRAARRLACKGAGSGGKADAGSGRCGGGLFPVHPDGDFSLVHQRRDAGAGDARPGACQTGPAGGSWQGLNGRARRRTLGVPRPLRFQP